MLSVSSTGLASEIEINSRRVALVEPPEMILSGLSFLCSKTQIRISQAVQQLWKEPREPAE